MILEYSKLILCSFKVLSSKVWEIEGRINLNKYL